VDVAGEAVDVRTEGGDHDSDRPTHCPSLRGAE
jgi:hypothetical protein